MESLMSIFKVTVNDRLYTVEVGDLSTSPVEVLVDGEPVQVELDDADSGNRRQGPRRATRRTAGITAKATETAITAPMPGRIVRVSVQEGEIAGAGVEVCVLETMKMEQSIRSSIAGVIKEVKVEAGDSVAAGDVLVELE
ncbi:MAG: glutaconyl-CoA decarboxylase [Chloroflexi bacterium]|jgi:biotin carboxyl carrier protein|nr:MAG: glutaconyl-CoA decarboxylase [Chloroflexota bacterium]